MGDLWEKVSQVNALLADGEPDNVSIDTFSGMNGYMPQAIWDAMNEVFGPCTWGFRATSMEVKGGIVVAEVETWLPGGEWRPITWGQSKILQGAEGDARKGAETDGAKKGFSKMSIGSRAYLGLLNNYHKDQQQKPRQEQRPRKDTQPKRIPLPEEPATPGQWSYIQKGCARLGWTVPEDGLTVEAAKDLIEEIKKAFASQAS